VETYISKKAHERKRTFTIQFTGVPSPKSTVHRYVNKFRTMGPLLNKKWQNTRNYFLKKL
jgi:hypothetical protein